MIAIVDYQMGNLRSVQKGFERVGHEALITNDAAQIAAAAKVVLPGVGAFGDAMAELRRRDLIGPLCDVIAEGKPFLGICLGLQLLFDVSYEGGTHEGLGVLAGEVRRFELPREYKVPHMGWNAAAPVRSMPLLGQLPPMSESSERKESREHPYFYFVHSYYVVPSDDSVVATETDYGGPFCSMICRDNLFATQFHPEKSQRHGLELLRRFGAL